MNYSTYISAAEKLSSFGQKQRALSLIKHANELEEKKINEFDFDILVGEVKTFSCAKFDSVRVLREKEGNTIMCIFKSGNNTHRINSTMKNDGSLLWSDGNLFVNRKSVNNFNKLLNHLKNYQKDVKKVLTDLALDNKDISIINRTYYK